MMARALIVVPLALMGCDMSVDPIVAADRCEARAQAAQAPSANVTVGTNSETGGFGRGNVSISSDFLKAPRTCVRSKFIAGTLMTAKTRLSIPISSTWIHVARWFWTR